MKADPAVLFARRQIVAAQPREIVLVTLVDLGHRKVLRSHYILSVFHILRRHRRIGGDRAAGPDAEPKLS